MSLLRWIFRNFGTGCPMYMRWVSWCLVGQMYQVSWCTVDNRMYLVRYLAFYVWSFHYLRYRAVFRCAEQSDVMCLCLLPGRQWHCCPSGSRRIEDARSIEAFHGSRVQGPTWSAAALGCSMFIGARSPAWDSRSLRVGGAFRSAVQVMMALLVPETGPGPGCFFCPSLGLQVPLPQQCA